MSVNPDQSSPADPTPPKAEPAGGDAESFLQKRRFKKGGAEPEEGEKPDQTIQLLSTLLQDLIAKKGTPDAPEVDPKPTTKYHRLSKTGSGTPSGPSEGVAPAPVVPPGNRTEDAPPLAAEPAPATPPAVTFRAAPQYETITEVRRRRRLHLLYIVGALTLAAAAYYLGDHYGAPGPQPDVANGPMPPTTPPWTDAAVNQLDQALAADQAGDLKGAQRLATAIQKLDAPAPAGLELYLAGLSTRLEHTYDVEADLLRAISKVLPAEQSVLNERLAFNFSRARNFDKAAEYFKTASRLDPFPAQTFYHLGEALRHQGHSQEAAANFRRALDRIPTGQPENESLRACINLKLRLSLVELSQESEFQNEMAEQLKAPSPSGYWLLTAAAVALQHKNPADAAGLFARARDALGATQFDGLLNDYFFRAYADRKELADFFPTDPVARRAKLLPTMTYTIEP